MSMALREYLTTRGPIEALVGDRVSQAASAQSSDGDRITYQVISGQHAAHLSAASGMVFSRIQINCISTDGYRAWLIGERVRDHLDGLRDTSLPYGGLYEQADGSLATAAGFVELRRARILDDDDNYIPAADDRDSGAYVRRLDFEFQYRESVPEGV